MVFLIVKSNQKWALLHSLQLHKFREIKKTGEEHGKVFAVRFTGRRIRSFGS